MEQAGAQMHQNADNMVIQPPEGAYGGIYERPPCYNPSIEKQPPPYVEPAYIRNVVCEVCRTQIPFSSNQCPSTVRCFICSEETAVGIPLPGQKYVRCSCNLLILCSAEFQSVLCPRESCRKQLTLVPTPAAFVLNSETKSVACANCSTLNQVNTSMNKFIKCCFCGKTSALDSRYGRQYGVNLTLLGVLIFVIALIINISINVGLPLGIAITLNWTICLALFVGAIACFGRGIWYIRMKVSSIIRST